MTMKYIAIHASRLFVIFHVIDHYTQFFKDYLPILEQKNVPTQNPFRISIVIRVMSQIWAGILL